MINKPGGNFFLDKTYLDCIDDAGNCFILYSATIKLYFFKINYSALIFSDQDDNIIERTSFHRSIISSGNQSLTFSNKHFEISGTWGKTRNPVESLLYKNSRGIVNWNCHHPLSRADIKYKNKTFSGWSYAETLYLTVKPWDLPIDELRWGRFLAPGISVIWIQWIGKNPVNKIYLDEKEFNDAQHFSEAITFDDGKNNIAFSKISLIRQSKFSNHLAGLSWLSILFCSGILNSIESKYKSKAIFRNASGVLYHGWCIFEIIKWEH